MQECCRPSYTKCFVRVIYNGPGACLSAQPVGAIKLLSAHHDACKQSAVML